MKHMSRILSLLLVLIMGCKKSNVSTPTLTGTWNWSATYNDGAPGPKNPLTPNNSGIIQTLEFVNADWNLTQNGALVSQGTYATSVAKSNLGKSINEIKFFRPNQTDSITYYTIINDTLSFSNDLSGSVGSSITFYHR